MSFSERTASVMVPDAYQRVALRWPLVPLWTVATCNDDVVPEGTDPEEDVRYVEIGDVDSVQGIADSTTYRFQDAPSRARRKVRPGDVLFSTVRTYLRAVAAVDSRHADVVASTGFAVIRPRRINSGFLRYVLFSDAFIEEVIARSVGISYPAINASDVMKLQIALPPLDEQRRIAAFLDHETRRIDKLVQEQERLQAHLDEQRQAVIRRAVTRGVHECQLEASPRIPWLGSIPDHWRVAPLKYVSSFSSGSTPSKSVDSFWGGEIPWASAKDMKVFELWDAEDHVTTKAVAQGGANLLPPGAVIVVVRGMILARTFPVAVTKTQMAINQDLKALLPERDVDPHYLAYYLIGTRDESLSRLEEAGHGTKALRMDKWSSLEITLPPLQEQRQIVERITQRIDTIAALAQEAQRLTGLLHERRSGLITAAVTGQIDVRDWRPGDETLVGELA